MRNGLAIDFAHAPPALDAVYFPSLAALDGYLRGQSRALTVVAPQQYSPVIQIPVEKSDWQTAVEHFHAGFAVLWLACLNRMQLAITKFIGIATACMRSILVAHILVATVGTYATILTALCVWR